MRRSRRRAGVDVDEEVYIDIKGAAFLPARVALFSVLLSAAAPES